MICSNCGKKVEEGQKFCPYCGKLLDSDSGVQQEFNQDQQTFFYGQPMFNQGQQMPKPKKKKHIGIFIVVAIIFIMIIAVALSSGSDDTSSSNESSKTTSEGTKDDSKTDTKNSGSDILDIYESLEDNKTMPFEITDKAKKFLEDNPDLFPTSGDIDDDLVDYDLNFRQILKNPSKYGDKLLYVQQGQVVETYESDEGTQLNVSDGEQQYWIFYLGTLDSIYKDSYVSFYGLPLDTSGFKNTDGGKTSVIVIAGAKVTDYSDSSTSSESDNTSTDNNSDDDRDYEQEEYENYLSQNYVLPFSDTQELDDDTVASLSDDELRYAINEMYARHGYHFKNADMQNFFNSDDWYVDKGITDQNEIYNEMSGTEKKNLKKLTKERDSR